MIRFLLLFCYFMLPLWGRPLKVDTNASAALLINADTGAILYEKEMHKRCYPASTTKLVTAFYILEKYGHRLDEMAVATAHALKMVTFQQRLSHFPSALEPGASNAGLRQGEILTIRELLYGLLLPSGDDAANVLAEAVSGTIDQFMGELNDFLKSHGIQETHFVNPHGLHHPDHWTTAHDMALMTRLALKNPVFCQMVKTTRYPRPQTNKQPANYWVQSNRLLRQGDYFYPKAIGVKTGFHSHAGPTLVSAATHEGRTLIAVLFNSADRNQRFRESIKLFEAAFAEKLISRVLFAKGSNQFSRQIKGATISLEAVLKDDLVIEYYPAEEPSLRAEIHWTHDFLPIQADEKIGFLRLITAEGEILKDQPLFALHDVNKKWWAYIVDGYRNHKILCIALFLFGQVSLLITYFLKKNQKIG